MARLTVRPLPRRRISLTALIDVVFILLVFFMLETTFLREGAVGVSGMEPGTSGTIAEKLSIELFDTETVWVNGRRFTGDTWEAAIREFDGRAELPVEVRTRAGVPVQQVVDTLDVLAGHGLERVSLGRVTGFGA